MIITGHGTYCGDEHVLRDEEGFWLRCWEAFKLERTSDTPVHLLELQ